MSKRKHAEGEDAAPETPSKRSRRQAAPSTGKASIKSPKSVQAESPVDSLKKRRATKPLVNGESRERSGSPTPRAKPASSSTPTKTPSSKAKTLAKTQADRSAKRKSGGRLIEIADEEDWDGESALVADILGGEQSQAADEAHNALEANVTTPADTPSKRGRGRPKGARNKRSPTPEGDIAPEERYFFQNRAGPPQYSTNLFSQVNLLTHDNYFELMRHREPPHRAEKAYLTKVHARSFPQWTLELSEGFSVCLYGYGSKRHLTHNFAEWLCSITPNPPHIVIVNGFTPKLSIRTILNTIASAVAPDDGTIKLTGQPQEMLDTLLSHLSQRSRTEQLTVLINSLDAASLRKPAVQSVLSKMAAHPLVNVIATVDTPTFPLLWSSTLLDQFNFVFHDCTTFASYEAEISVVDDIYDLLGRKGRRIGGKEGIGFVLKSLPPNARNLYRILLSEVLSIIMEDAENAYHHDGEDEDMGRSQRQGQQSAEEIGVEYRLLYQKASEEFICSSDMNFRFLLKEFHDHQMITSRRDGGGTELLCIPLGKEEMQSVLEDLVMS